MGILDNWIDKLEFIPEECREELIRGLIKSLGQSEMKLACLCLIYQENYFKKKLDENIKVKVRLITTETPYNFPVIASYVKVFDSKDPGVAEYFLGRNKHLKKMLEQDYMYLIIADPTYKIYFKRKIKFDRVLREDLNIIKKAFEKYGEVSEKAKIGEIPGYIPAMQWYQNNVNLIDIDHKYFVSKDPLISTLAGAKAQEKYKPAKQPNVTPKPEIKPKTTTTLKKCPFCGEEILATAIKCKHCGEWLGEKPYVEGNTSGQGKLAVVPEEIKKWNWGAFLLNWIWGIGNNVWIALLCLIPYVNFIMIFVLGAKGSEWAWQKKRWDSIEHFKNVQKKWAIAGLVLFIFGIVMVIISQVIIASTPDVIEKILMTTEEESEEVTKKEVEEKPPLISEVHILDITQTSALIQWNTDKPCYSQIEYGTTRNYGQITPLSSELVINHSIILNNLKPDSTYYFRIKSKDSLGTEAVSDDFTLNTLKLLSLKVSGLEDITVQTICLNVEQSYPEIEEEFSLPIDEFIHKLLEEFGFHIVKEGDSCEATLRVDITGYSLGAPYIPGGYCYSGAEVDGQILLTIPEYEQITFPISAKSSPPSLIYSCPEKPSNAPFESVWPEALFNGLTQLWGPQIAIKSLGDEDIYISSAARDALVNLGEPAVEPLIEALKDEDYHVRDGAADALGNIGDERAIEPLIQTLKDKEWPVRSGAAHALGKIGDINAVEPLINALEDEESFVRWAAAQALGNIGDNQAVGPLIEALKDEDYMVREHAAIALGNIGDERAIEPLTKVLNDEDYMVRDAAKEALEKIKTK